MKHDDDFEQRIRSALDTSVKNLDAGTRSRLTVMRSAALEQKSFSLRNLSFGTWVSVTAVAATVIFAVTLAISPVTDESHDQFVQQDADVALELLLNGDLQEEIGDPAFYAWLDSVLLEEEEAGNAS